jgi:hypothetical protein
MRRSTHLRRSRSAHPPTRTTQQRPPRCSSRRIGVAFTQGAKHGQGRRATADRRGLARMV